jgi:hypothetical protein
MNVCPRHGTPMRAVWDRSEGEPRVAGWVCDACERDPLTPELRQKIEQERREKA